MRAKISFPFDVCPLYVRLPRARPGGLMVCVECGMRWTEDGKLISGGRSCGCWNGDAFVRAYS